ncbi:MAG: Gfo/Idh/MocA family oxidoreductase [Clostridia bacterium]|nr:Gfo/Idh/MocA family oxidoreductase [Clostridia bacterium]
MSKLKIGIIGCGGIANGKHMPALKELGDMCEMVAFCDIVEQKAVDAAKKYGAEGAKTYVDYKELLADDSIDVVHVCTPNREHSFITVDALEAGKHVYCEKPMAKSYAEAKKMYDAAERTGKKLTIGYQNRQHGQHQYAKTVCDAGEIGEVYFAEAFAIRRRAVPTWGVFLNEEEQGGGPLIDIGTHALDLTLWMMNNYKPKLVVGNTFFKLREGKGSANAWGDWDTDKFTVEDSAFGYIRMENGAVIMLKSSWALNYADPAEACYIICGDKGGIDSRGDLKINFVKNGRQVLELPSMSAGGAAYFAGKGSDTDVNDMYQWLNAVITDTDPCVLPYQALCVSQILEAIYTSAKTGEPVVF